MIKKTLEWAKVVIETIVPSLVAIKVMRQGAQKIFHLSKTFGIWVPDCEGTEIKDILELIDQYNANIHLKDMWVKYKAKGSGGLLHVEAVKEPSLKGLKEIEYAPFADFKRVQFQQQKKLYKRASYQNHLKC